jgi:4-amino-4-deoxy-L-arabinose transferase-like glycosyltransferase
MNSLRVHRLLLLATLLLGFGLRVLRLDADSLWSDEAGQVMAALHPTWEEMAAAIRVHAGSMPLDYLITRAASTLGVDEFTLRFPAVWWGMLALPLFYVLARRATNATVALISVYLFALMPLQVRYSQELRFYAALVFCYLLTFWLLLRALERPLLVRWLLFLLAGVVGIYLHPYVALVLVPGALFGGWQWLHARQPQRHLLMLPVAGIIFIVAFLPGYWMFNAGEVYANDINAFGGSIMENLLVGLGWCAYAYLPDNRRFGLWEALNLVLAMVGGLALGRGWRQWPVAACWVVGAILQIVLVIAADWVSHYPFVPRQILPFSLAATLLTGIGATTLLDWPAARRRFARWQQWAPVAATAVLTLAAVRPLQDQYAYPRSNASHVLNALRSRHAPGQPVYIIPGHESVVLEFYALSRLTPDTLSPDLHRSTWSQVDALTDEAACPSYVVAPLHNTQDEIADITQAGFIPLYQPDLAWSGNRALFTRLCP